MKKLFIVLLFVASSVFASEWSDYLQYNSPEVIFVANMTLDRFKAAAATFSYPNAHRIDEIPKLVWQAACYSIDEEYNKKVGNTFVVSMGYDWTQPKTISILMRYAGDNQWNCVAFQLY